MIAQITSAPAPFGPALMGLLLILVLANHPQISPDPMPKGVLVLAMVEWWGRWWSTSL